MKLSRQKYKKYLIFFIIAVNNFNKSKNAGNKRFTFNKYKTRTACGGSPLVGMTGLEPAASWSQTKHSTKLSYIPIYVKSNSAYIASRLTAI